MQILIILGIIFLLAGWPYHIYKEFKRQNNPNYIRLRRFGDQIHLIIKNDQGMRTAILRKLFNINGQIG